MAASRMTTFSYSDISVFKFRTMHPCFKADSVSLLTAGWIKTRIYGESHT